MGVLPILCFILLYVFAAICDYFEARPWVAALMTAGFIPYATATVPLFSMIPGLGSSTSYAAVPLLILVYAPLLRKRLPDMARGLAIGARLAIASLTFRKLDQPLCGALLFGTHFLWHVLNAVMLGWMIEVWHWHRLAPA